MARGGASVGVNDLGGSQDGEGRDVGPAEEVVAEIRAAGGQAIVNAADISDPAAAASIVEDALGAFGKLDAVVNNAGILRDRIFHKMSQVDWDDVIRTHLNGYSYVSKTAALNFKVPGAGASVPLTTTPALIGTLGQANY